MRRYARTLLWTLAAIVALASWAEAQTTFEWDRNVETDMGVYKVFACSTSASCVPGTGPTDQIGIDISQPAVGVKPSMPIPVNTEGRAGVIAIDLVGNRSGLSNLVPFDRKAPAAAGLVTK